MVTLRSKLALWDVTTERTPPNAGTHGTTRPLLAGETSLVQSAAPAAPADAATAGEREQ